MTLQFQCKGCNHEQTEPESDHARKGFCISCDAKGVGLPQIKKVEKWEARDGSFHDSLEDAERYQLKAELETALKVGEGYVQRQAAHLLSHFDIVRKGDTPKVWYGPVLNTPHHRPKKVLHFWSFFIGATIATSVMLYLFR